MRSNYKYLRRVKTSFIVLLSKYHKYLWSYQLWLEGNLKKCVIKNLIVIHMQNIDFLQIFFCGSHL